MMKVVKYFILGAVLLMIAIGLMSCKRSGKLQTIEVAPANAIIPVGWTQPFTATAVFSDGSTLNWTTSSTWSSGDENMASVSNAIGLNGLATALTATTISTTAITATDLANNISGQVILTVTPLPIISIAIAPADAIISTGTTTLFKATGIFADGTSLDYTLTVTWSSSNPGAATISNTAGSNGLVTAVAAGTTTITATDPATHILESTTLMVE
jgi:trimeric autotransporter adhesin